jgi:hypothetical protein
LFQDHHCPITTFKQGSPILLIVIVWLFAIGMAGHTVDDIKNIFIGMFFNHFILLMAGCTGVDGRIIAWMTGTTHAISALMIEREGVGKIYITEV